MQFQKLYGKASTGKVKQWEIEAIETDEGFGIVRQSHGYLDGKIQVNDRVIKKGKNIGRANETTPYEQACSEAESKWKKKQDKNYMLSIEDLESGPKNVLPMLAHPFKKRKHNIVYPCYGEHKFNGVRCISIKEEGKDVRFQSRGGKSYDETLKHLVPLLNESMRDGEILDGEIYVHGWTFQRIVSAVKKNNKDTPLLQYFVYDVVDTNGEDLPFTERKKDLTAIVAEIDNDSVVLTESKKIRSEEEVYEWHDKFVQQGYEGIMIRNLSGKYKFDGRSVDLQKYKQFFDEEFKVVGATTGEGLEDGCVIWICVNEDGKKFNVRPRGSREGRREKYKNRHEVIGKKDLTTRFQEFSEDLVPIFPVGIVVRDYE